MDHWREKSHSGNSKSVYEESYWRRKGDGGRIAEFTTRSYILVSYTQGGDGSNDRTLCRDLDFASILLVYTPAVVDGEIDSVPSRAIPPQEPTPSHSRRHKPPPVLTHHNNNTYEEKCILKKRM